MTPSDVPGALARAGWDVVGRLGGGADGPVVVRGRTGEPQAVVLVDGTDHALVARCRTLAQVRSPYLPRCGAPEPLDDGRLAVPVELVDGPDLATLVNARGALTPAQVVTLTVPVAAALAALHEHGLAHGDVSPANVVVRRDGRPALVDLVRGAGRGEAGTDGFRAPERVDGDASAPGDVHALARTAVAVLGDGDDDAHHVVRQVLEPALAADPAVRPDARALAAAVYDALPGAPLLVPSDDVLAGSTLRRLADPGLRTVVRPRRPRGRHRRRRRVRAGHVVVLAAVLVAAGGLVVATADRSAPEVAAAVPSPATTPAATPVGTPAPTAPSRDEPPEEAARRLTHERATALAAGDEAALAAVTVPGSPAAAADRSALGELAGAGAVRREPVVDVTDVRLLDPSSEDVARVLVVARAGVEVEGAAPDRAPERRVVLVLERVDGSWRVQDVEPA